MTLDFSYRSGASSVTAVERRRRHVVETWEVDGSAGAAFLVDAHLPEVVERIVVMAHGADNSRHARYVEVSGKAFVRHGTAVIVMDAPGHGDRPDAAPLDMLPGLLPGVLEEWVRDHRILADVIADRWPGLPLGFAGFSMGGLFGVPLLAVDTRFASGAIVIAGSTRVSYPPRIDLDDSARAVLDVTDPAAHAAAVGDRPVMVLCADADEIVPRAAAEALYDAFVGPKELVFMPGTHTEWGHAARWYRRLESFFEETLR